MSLNNSEPREKVVTEYTLQYLICLQLLTFVLMLLMFKNLFGGKEEKKKILWNKKYVLITGCDRGLGHETAKRLDSFGFSVIAGCLNVDSSDVEKLRQNTSANLKTVQLDVTKREDLTAVRQWMNENLDGELWGVVNNAGVCFVGTPEIMAHRDIETIIKTNLQGVIDVTTKFLPLIRKSKGRIINMGSLNGEVAMPFFSLYNATKAAVESFTESLSYELQPWGVKASLVAPAGFKTGIINYDRTACANRWWAEASDEVRKDFGKDYFTMPMRVSGRMTVSDDFSPVTDAVVHALTSESPRNIYRVGQYSTLLPAMCKFSPTYIRSFICGYFLNFISIRPAALQAADDN